MFCLAEAKALPLLCASACPKNSPVGNNHTSARLFSTRKTRKFRNYHPAHFDSTDHRFAMGGCYGTCVRLLPFSIPPQAVGPMIPSSSLSLYRRRVTPKPLRLCVPTKDSLLLSCLGGTADATLGHDKATKNCSMIHRSDKLYIIYKV